MNVRRLFRTRNWLDAVAEGHASGARHSVFVSRAKLENHHFRLAHFGCSGRIGHQSKAVRRPRLQAVRAQACLPLRGDAKRQSGGGFVPAQAHQEANAVRSSTAAKGPEIGVAWRLRHRTGGSTRRANERCPALAMGRPPATSNSSAH